MVHRPQETEGEAEFNMGISFLDRINYQLYCYNEACRLTDMENMMKILERIYAEIYPMVKVKNRQLLTDKRKEVVEGYEKLKQYRTNYYQGGASSTGMKFSPPKDFSEKCIEWELLLRIELKEAGMLMPMKSKTLAAAKTDFNY